MRTRIHPRKQVIDPFPNLPLHIFYRAGREHPRIASASPEGDLFPELSFQPGAVHSRSLNLHRVENFHADIDEVGNDLENRAAGMEVDVSIGFLLYRVDYCFFTFFIVFQVHGPRENEPGARGPLPPG